MYKKDKNVYGVRDFKGTLKFKGTLEDVAEYLNLKPQSVLVKLIRQKKNPFIARRYTIEVLKEGVHGSKYYDK